MSVTPWTPIFEGIDRAVGTNYPDGSTPIPRRQSVNCVRVDLWHPDVQLFSTPPASNRVAESRETLSMSVSNFLKQYRLEGGHRLQLLPRLAGRRRPLVGGGPV